MYQIMAEYIEEIANVRPSMEYKVECLVNPSNRMKTRSYHKSQENEIADEILMKDIETALLQSMIDHENKLKEEQQKENEIRERRIEALSKFENIRQQMSRVAKIDKDIRELNDLLWPMIETYCEDTRLTSSLDEDTYKMIMKDLKSICLRKEDIELVESLFVTKQ